MKKTSGLFLAVMFFSLLVAAFNIQGVLAQMNALWTKTYGGTDSDVAFSVVQTADGGCAVAGYTNSYGAGGLDFWLVRTDANGNAVWNKTYGGIGEDEAHSLIKTLDGGYALGGSTTSYSLGGGDFWLVKTDANGIASWNKTYGGTLFEVANSVIQTADGGYALAGYTSSYGAGGFDYWLVKTDANGNALWNRTYGGNDTDVAYSVVQTPDGGYALAGHTVSFGAGYYDFWLVRTDSDGIALWNKTYGGLNTEEGFSMTKTADGGYALAGPTWSYGVGGDFWLVKTDANGNALWNRTYGGTGREEAYSIVQTADGGYALAGITDSYGAGTYDFWLVRTNEVGSILWNKTYGGTGTDWCYSLANTSDGGYALAGLTISFGAGVSDFWLVKTVVDVIPEFPPSIVPFALIVIVTLVASLMKMKPRANLPRTS